MPIDLTVFTAGLEKELSDRDLLNTKFKGVYHFPFNFVSTTKRDGKQIIVREVLGLRFLTTSKLPGNRISRVAIGRVFAVLNNSLEQANIIGTELAIAYEDAITDYMQSCAIGVKGGKDGKNNLGSRVELFQDEHTVRAIVEIQEPDPIFNAANIGKNPLLTSWCCRVLIGWDLYY
jgi:hypothetical protein